MIALFPSHLDDKDEMQRFAKRFMLAEILGPPLALRSQRKPAPSRQNPHRLPARPLPKEP